MLQPEQFLIFPSNQTGDCYGTEFTAIAAGIPVDYTKITWDLGNGLYYYNTRNLTFSYDYPGIYTVSLSAWNNDGNLTEDKAEINVDYAFRDYLTFTQIPSTYGTPGLPSSNPFVVTLITSKVKEDLSIVLQSLNSKSVPHYAVPDKWSFITPKWKFVDASTNKILDGPIVLKKEPIYKNSKIVAMSAQASFYYIDDLSTGENLNDSCPLLLVATLSTENFKYPRESLIYPYNSYSNSEVTRATIAWQINDVIPTKLKVTENYLNDVYPIKWSGIPIPVLVTCQFDSNQIETFNNAASAFTDVLSYPRTNELGATSPVVILLSSVGGGLIPSDLYQIENFDGEFVSTEQASLYFKSNDENGNSSSGYVFTSIKPLSSFNTSVVIAVSTVATNSQSTGEQIFGFPDGFPIYPNAYISNPAESSINKINIVTYPSNCDNINYYKDLGFLIEGTASTITVPTTRTANLSTFALSGTAGVYGLAFNPLNNKLYATDADQDTLFVLNGGTNITNTINLSSVTGYDDNVPSYISIDSTGSVWVSLYGYERLLKFDENLQFLLSAVPPVSLSLYSEGSLIVEPPVVETDQNDDIWACYSHPFSSLLVKFDGATGQTILSADALSLSSVPVSLSINSNNDVWVACRESNKLELYSSTSGALLSSVEGFFYRPSYTAIDRSNNVWFTHGYNFCSVYDTTTKSASTWKFETNFNTITPVLSYSVGDIELALTENEVWGGLAVDVFNRVWVIDSLYNIVHVFNANDPIGTSRQFAAIPKPDTNYVVLGGDTFITEIEEDIVRSAQASGDWTGNKWYQKYASGYGSLSIKGQSTPFAVYDLNDSYKITKVNEEFDIASYFKSLALPEVLSQNAKLFDEFMSAVAGDGNPMKEDAGRIIYERIANFISTHGDFETAEIDQLISLATQVDVPAQLYGKEFPAEVNRLLNMFSVPKHRLRGVPNYETDILQNIGDYVTQGTMISAGQLLVLQDKQYQKYQLINVAESQTNQQVYPIEDIDVEGIRKPILANYYVYQYQQQQNGYIDNLINWDSDHTTIQYSLSTNEEWYGDDGLIEIMFNNLLTKRLFSE